MNNKSTLDRQLKQFETEVFACKRLIDMEKRNILRSFQAIKRTSGSSHLGLPPNGRTDNSYARSFHSKSGLRLSEKRLMEWKRKEKELHRFMREMKIGPEILKSRSCPPTASRSASKSQSGEIEFSELEVKETNENSAKIFRLYLENDKIRSKLENKLKNEKILKLDKNHFIKVPENVYIREELESKVPEVNQWPLVDADPPTKRQSEKDAVVDRHRTSLQQKLTSFSVTSHQTEVSSGTSLTTQSQSTKQTTLSNGTKQRDDKTTITTSARTRPSSETKEFVSETKIFVHERESFNNSENTASKSKVKTPDKKDETPPPEKDENREQEFIPNLILGPSNGLEKMSNLKRQKSAAKKPFSSQFDSLQWRLTHNQKTSNFYNRQMTRSVTHYRQKSVNNGRNSARKHVHSNHLYDPYVYESEKEEELENDSVFIEPLATDDGEADVTDFVSKLTSVFYITDQQNQRKQEEDNKQQTPSLDSDVRVGTTPNTQDTPVYCDVNEIKTSDYRPSDITSTAQTTDVISRPSLRDKNKLPNTSPIRDFKLTSVSFRSDVDKTPPSDDWRKFTRHSISDIKLYRGNHSNKTSRDEIKLSKVLRKSKSEIFIEHPPKITSCVQSLSSAVNVAMAFSKLARKKSLHELVVINNPDQNETLRLEKLKNLQKETQKLSIRASQFNLLEK